MSFITELRDDLREMVYNDVPTNFLFNGTAYVGTASERGNEPDLVSGGFLDDYSLTLVMPLQVKVGDTWQTQFATEPAHGDQVTISGTTYKIEAITRSQDGLALTATLNTTAK